MRTDKAEPKSLANLFLEEVETHYPEHQQFRTVLKVAGSIYHSRVMTRSVMVEHLEGVQDHVSLHCIEGRKTPDEEWEVV